MVKFKDIVKKAKEMAEKGVELVKTQLEIQKALRDFDEKVGNIIVDILQSHGYRGMGGREEGGRYVVQLAIENDEKVKHIIDRDLMRRYSAKDREKIVNLMADRLVFTINYAGRAQPGARFSDVEDTTVEAALYYIVERKGFLGVKKEERRIYLGKFGFLSTDFVDTERLDIDREKLRSYLEEKLRGLGLI